MDYYVLKRKSDGMVMEARAGKKFKKIPTGWAQVKLTKEVKAGGTLDSAKKYTAKPVDVAAETADKAVVDAFMALDPKKTGLTAAQINTKLNKVIKYLQR